MRAAAIAALGLFAALPASALQIDLPHGAEQSGGAVESFGSYDLPVAAWTTDGLPTLSLEGRIEKTAWRLNGGPVETLALLAPLREQIETAGFSLLFECETDTCGGFDFRYAAALLPEPDMHVDLGDFRYLAARSGNGAEAEYIGLMVSRSAESGFVQITRIGPQDAPSAPVAIGAASSKSPATVPFSDALPDLGAALDTAGTATLDDLSFPSGSSHLEDRPYASLEALAAWLAAHPEGRITLVGHTDAEGSLAANIALSRQRAQSVMEKLIASYGITATRVAADGVGYLAPRASNMTETGRRENRRVEAIVTSTR